VDSSGRFCGLPMALIMVCALFASLFALEWPIERSK